MLCRRGGVGTRACRLDGERSRPLDGEVGGGVVGRSGVACFLGLYSLGGEKCKMAWLLFSLSEELVGLDEVLGLLAS